LILAHISDTTDYEHGATGTSSASYSPRLLLAILEPTVGPAHANREDEVEFLVERSRIGSARDPRVFLERGSESIGLSAMGALRSREWNYSQQRSARTRS
jgi:hypothetical protein